MYNVHHAVYCDRRPRSVVCQLCGCAAKNTAERIEVLFGVETLAARKHTVLDGDRVGHWGVCPL